MAKTMTTEEFGKMLHAWRREKEENRFSFQERKQLKVLLRQLKSIPTTKEGKVELRNIMVDIKRGVKMIASNPDYRRELLVKDFTSLGLFLTAAAETRETDTFGRETFDMARASALVEATRENGTLGLGNSAVTNGEFRAKADRILTADGATKMSLIEDEMERIAIAPVVQHTMQTEMSAITPAEELTGDVVQEDTDCTL